MLASAVFVSVAFILINTGSRTETNIYKCTTYFTNSLPTILYKYFALMLSYFINESIGANQISLHSQIFFSFISLKSLFIFKIKVVMRSVM